jgi:hypothetical protein
LPGFLTNLIGGGAAAPVGTQATLSGLVNFTAGGQPFIQVPASQLAGLVNVPADSPASSPNYYY